MRKISPIFYNLRGGQADIREKNFPSGSGEVDLDPKLGKNRVFLNFSLCAKFNRFFIILGGARFAQRKIHIFVKNRGFSVILLKFDNFGKNWVISVILIKSYNFNRNTIISNKLDSLGKENSVFLNFCVGAKFNRFFIILGGVQVRPYIRSQNLINLLKRSSIYLKSTGMDTVRGRVRYILGVYNSSYK